jgi:chloramphenicol-sensitive protein RarD
VSDQRGAAGRSGLLYGLAAYGLWGVLPLYFVALKSVQPAELLAQRIVWSVLLLFALLTFLGRWGELKRCLAVGRTRWLLLASTLLLAVNWFGFIYGVWSEQTIQTSLGYFINPLVSIALGVLFFRERLRLAQWVGLALASAGLLYMILALGQVPWIALALAFSFGHYGLLRKIAPVDGLVGLSIETLFLLPVALAFLAGWAVWGEPAFGRSGWQIDVLLLLSGAVTAIPLICFGQAARRLPLSTLGFLQYLAPTLQFLFAVLMLEEQWLRPQQIGFGCIWAALAIVSVDSVRAQRQRSAAEERALTRAPAAGRGPVPVR